MAAIQVPAPVVLVAHKIRSVLSACRQHNNPANYAYRLVCSLADVTHSQYAVWLNWPPGPDSVIAQTDGVNPLGRCLVFNQRLPLLVNDADSSDGIRSIAAAPVHFRDTLVGALGIANGAVPYTPRELDLFAALGRI